MRTLTVLLVASILAPAACGDGAPLGGPWGGTEDPVAPNTHPAADAGPADDSGDETDSSASPDTSTAAPTWTDVFNKYLAKGTTGNCAASGCHSQMGNKSQAYSWLQALGYIAGKNSVLVSPTSSCLSWYGGNMPIGGGGNPQAKSDMDAWAAAGAANN